MSREVTCDGRLPRSRPARSNSTHLSALVCATLLGAALAMVGCARTRPFIDAQGKPLRGSIASMETAEIGGIEQSLWFRGIDASMPALILLHGGPGASEAALFRHYDADLEKHFLVVYWDQRGAGRSSMPTSRSSR